MGREEGWEGGGVGRVDLLVRTNHMHALKLQITWTGYGPN